MSRTNRSLRGLEIEPGCSFYYKKFEAADIASLFTTDIIVKQGGANEVVRTYYCATKFTPGSTQYNFDIMSGSVGFNNTNSESTNFVGKSQMNGTDVAYTQEGPWKQGSGHTSVSWDANDTDGLVKLTASGTAPTQGDGTVEVWWAGKTIPVPGNNPA